MTPKRRRRARDPLGWVEVPADAPWGPQTQRAIENFPISGIPMDLDVIRALVEIKRASAIVNERAGLLDADLAAAIVASAAEILAGDWAHAFPVDVFQTGSGTSTNMNVNEVIARRTTALLEGTRIVHPNDHVNASQSSNDTFPSAIRIAAARAALNDLVPALDALAATFGRLGSEWPDAVRPGRTHLMDALPTTFGRTFAAYQTQLAHAVRGVERAVDDVVELPLGGTAVGTGYGAPPNFGHDVCIELGRELGFLVTAAAEPVSAQGAHDALVSLSAATRLCAIVLYKIASDVKLMASGPDTGFGEIVLPALQAGSSMMPGKVNPVLCESVAQVAVHVMGLDAAIAFAGSQGALELNTFGPMIGHDLLTMLKLTARSAALFDERCISGLRPVKDHCDELARRSLARATAAIPLLGHDRTADAVATARTSGRPIEEVVAEISGLDVNDVADLLDPYRIANS